MKPGTYIACGACGHKRGVAAATCPRFDCPWLSNHGYRDLSSKQLGMLADHLFEKSLRQIDNAYRRSHEVA